MISYLLCVQLRTELTANPDHINKVLQKGTLRAREVAKETFAQVKKAMKIDYFNN